MSDLTERPYIYESPDGGKTIYRRHAGETERELIGYKYEPTDQEQLEVYREMIVLARTHPGLAEELERVKMYYYLLKKQDNEVFWHPV